MRRACGTVGDVTCYSDVAVTVGAGGDGNGNGGGSDELAC
jgi:hypothetical protein